MCPTDMMNIILLHAMITKLIDRSSFPSKLKIARPSFHKLPFSRYSNFFNPFPIKFPQASYAWFHTRTSRHTEDPSNQTTSATGGSEADGSLTAPT